MQKNKKNAENANQTSESFDLTSLKDTFMSLLSETNPFPVDFDEAWQWIGFSRKNNAKRILIREFESNRDFILLFKEQNKATSKSNPEKIYLTVDCFKAFCMLADTGVGKQVRRYYLDLEKDYFEWKKVIEQNSLVALIDKRCEELMDKRLQHFVTRAMLMNHKIDMERELKDNLLIMEAWVKEDILPMLQEAHDEQEEKIEKMERFLKAMEEYLKNYVPNAETPEVVAAFYVIREGNEFIFKLGNSIEVDTRGVVLNVGNSKPLTVVLTIPFTSARIAKSFENHLHEVFAHKRIRGEWFRLDNNDLTLISRLGILYEAFFYNYNA